jgi:hypothetical protein
MQYLLQYYLHGLDSIQYLLNYYLHGLDNIQHLLKYYLHGLDKNSTYRFTPTKWSCILQVVICANWTYTYTCPYDNLGKSGKALYGHYIEDERRK